MLGWKNTGGHINSSQQMLSLCALLYWRPGPIIITQVGCQIVYILATIVIKDESHPCVMIYCAHIAKSSQSVSLSYNSNCCVFVFNPSQVLQFLIIM